MKSPERLASLRRDLRQVPDHRSSPYLQACLKETARRYSGVSMLRHARRPTDVCPGITTTTDVAVPKGAVVAISGHLTHRDPNIYRDADEWVPERWLEEPDLARRVNAGDRLAYFPFGAGAHRCPGEKLAGIIAAAIVGTAALDFDVAWGGGERADLTKLDFSKACTTQALLGGDAPQRIVTAQDDTYTDARLGEKIQFEQFPALIAYVKDAAEVAPLIRCAQSAGIKAVPRNGGHQLSYPFPLELSFSLGLFEDFCSASDIRGRKLIGVSFSSYSALTDTLVIDLAHLNYVHVSEDHSTAKVGAGIRLGALYTALSGYDTTWIGGICPTVGLTGLLGAGGFNMQMRALGISSDHVLSAQLVAADGQTLHASPSSNPDLFWAIRGGGGGTYGVITELELQLTKLPRSAMVAISWNESESRFAAAKRFLEWAPRQPKEFTSQINVYKSSVQVLGWYLGRTQQELQALLNDSGLLAIGHPESQVTGDCSTDNSRIFGIVTNVCLPDDKVDPSILNVVPESFSKYENSSQFTYEEVPLSTTRATAEPWPRFRRLSKSFFVQKDNLLGDDTLREVVDRIAQLDDASGVWGEWHAWNISAAGENAFAWREQAYAHLEFQVHGSNDSTKQAGYEKWFADLEAYLRPAVGYVLLAAPGRLVDAMAYVLT
ncbi:MAG: hypothetical protein Q9194_007454 [Teloschistes cf. exilis]